MPYVWTGPVPVGSYDDEPALILPDWLGPRELGQIEETTGGRILEVPSTDRVQVWRADGDGGWVDMGYVDNFEIEQADRLRHEYDRSLGEILRAHKLEVQFQAPHEFVQDWAQAYPWMTSRPADWVELWSRHMLNGPAALLGEGWRRQWVDWSLAAMVGLVGELPLTRWGVGRWAQWEQGHRRKGYAAQWQHLLDGLRYPDQVAQEWLQRSWEQSKGMTLDGGE